MLRAAALAVLLVLGAVVPAQACRLALALALDTSSSVDTEEDRLMRLGLASALLAPEVQAVMFAERHPVALAAYEWSGRNNQVMLLDWMLIETPGDLAAAAGRIGSAKRAHDDFPTALGYALGYGAGLLQRAPPCDTRTLDIAGDGVNNDGFPPQAAYGAFPLGQVTVNGLAITVPDGDDLDPLVRYYLTEVLHGPGAFLEVARGFDDFERAMRRKLERELSPYAIGILPEGDRRQPG